MAAVWKGSIAFGLVNVPVRLHAATQDHDVSFRQVCVSNRSTITCLRMVHR